MHRWLRIRLQDRTKEYDDMHMDVLVDYSGHLVQNAPYCGWFGPWRSTEVWPFLYHKNSDGKWYIDFGSDPQDDQSERYHLLTLVDTPVETGRFCHFHWDDRVIDMHIVSVADMAAGVAVN